MKNTKCIYIVDVITSLLEVACHKEIANARACDCTLNSSEQVNIALTCVTGVPCIINLIYIYNV